MTGIIGSIRRALTGDGAELRQAMREAASEADMTPEQPTPEFCSATGRMLPTPPPPAVDQVRRRLDAVKEVGERVAAEAEAEHRRLSNLAGTFASMKASMALAEKRHRETLEALDPNDEFLRGHLESMVSSFGASNDGFSTNLVWGLCFLDALKRHRPALLKLADAAFAKDKENYDGFIRDNRADLEVLGLIEADNPNN